MALLCLIHNINSIDFISSRLIEWGNRCPNDDRLYLTLVRHDNIEHDILSATFITYFRHEFVDIGSPNYIGVWMIKRRPNYVDIVDK